LVGAAGPKGKSAIEKIPDWTVTAAEMDFLQWAVSQTSCGVYLVSLATKW
jgi:hypothetical protein